MFPTEEKGFIVLFRQMWLIAFFSHISPCTVITYFLSFTKFDCFDTFSHSCLPYICAALLRVYQIMLTCVSMWFHMRSIIMNVCDVLNHFHRRLAFVSLSRSWIVNFSSYICFVTVQDHCFLCCLSYLHFSKNILVGSLCKLLTFGKSHGRSVFTWDWIRHLVFNIVFQCFQNRAFCSVFGCKVATLPLFIVKTLIEKVMGLVYCTVADAFFNGTNWICRTSVVQVQALFSLCYFSFMWLNRKEVSWNISYWISQNPLRNKLKTMMFSHVLYLCFSLYSFVKDKYSHYHSNQRSMWYCMYATSFKKVHSTMGTELTTLGGSKCLQ